MSTAECYLKTARHRQNLTIVTEAHTNQLILEGKRCVGVTYERGGQIHEARARREVILSAGAIGSPHILELSGIGRPDLLKTHGIEVLHEMDAVGENLRDHIIARMQWKLSQAHLSYNHRASGLGLVGEVARYLLTRRGFLSLPAAPVMGFLKSRPELASPDIQLFAIPYAIKDVKRRIPQPFPAMGFSVCQLRPESLGSIHIRSADPYAQPAIRFNFMGERIDQETMIASVKMAREIADQAPLEKIRGVEFVPGAEVSTDDEIEHWIRSTSETAYHPIGTCRMGPNGVVDDHLRVYGLEGLRVADASIFPTMPSGNTNAPSIMVGEKCADLIKADAVAT
jgi:choline dehydrogenase